MKAITTTKWKITASLFCMALLTIASSASAALTVTTTNEYGSASTYPFTPSWTPATNSLIAGLAPSAATGDFALDLTTRDVNSLTAGGSLAIDTLPGDRGPDPIGNTTTSSNYVTCGNGSGAGSSIVYTLPANTYGYDLTNITVFSGWGDSGRDGQAYTVYYATAANPSNYIYLTSVSYNPSVPGSTPTANESIVADSVGGVIAANVVAVQFVFTFPGTENGWAGYGAVTVEGTASSGPGTAPPITITPSTETGTSPFTPSWTAESPNLIAGAAPTTATGNFTQETSGGTSVLTDGAIGTSGDNSTLATCGANGGGTLIYTLTNSVNGSDVTNIVVYSGWGDAGRDGQYYVVSYSTVSAPTTYIPMATVIYNPSGTSGAVANRVAITTSSGVPLGSGVANIKFDFATPAYASQFDNGYQGYSEIIVQGNDTAAPPPPPSPYLTEDTLPTYTETVVGDQVVFTAAYSNSPPADLQWQFISGGMTNDIAGATNATLTLNDVQLTNSGSYILKAVNATNGSAAPSYSTAASLVVSNVPAAVNNVIMKYAEQCGWGAAGTSTNFYPTWTLNTNNDLILGFPTTASGPGTATAGAGDYGMSGANGDPTILADGSLGYLNYWPGVGGSPALVSCGPFGGAGLSMTYELDTSSAPNGFDLTNIVVYGGWGDNGRDEQKYQILYSTVAAPTTFISLGTFDYNPTNPNNAQSATRVTLVPETGVLAHNVYAVQINWNLQGSPPKNGWEGYSEIIINGTNSAPKPVLTQSITPLTADDVVGSTLTLTAGFSGASSYQWQKNGTNIPGATAASLTLTNLQVSDTATNGGYRLVASNASGDTATRECSVKVNPVPTAVGNVVVSFAHQTSDAGSFSPTWDTSTFFSSLIAYAYPDSYGTGDFTDPDVNPNSHGLAGGLYVLTDADYGSIIDGGAHPAFATCGPSAGQFVVYTLPASLYGYNITNILIASGWNDGGRDDLWGTVSYSTVANPTTFTPIAVVTNEPVVTAKSVTRAILTSTNGVIVSNAYAIKVDFTTPPGTENGYVGISQINVFGEPSVTNTLPLSVAVENQSTNNPSWTVETPSLISGDLPSSTGGGAFAGGFNGEPDTMGLPALTDGTLGPFDMGVTNFATCGGAFGAGSSVTYTAPAGTAWTLTNIVVYSGWGNYDRDGQFYNVLYRTYDDLTTTKLLVPITYNPAAPDPQAETNSTVNRVQITPANGNTTLATNVYSVTVDFSVQTGSLDNGYSGYSEIVLQGTTNAAPALVAPVLAPVTASGSNLILTGTGGTPGADYTWLTSTNVAAPLSAWTTNTTGVLDGSGSFSNAIPVDPGEFTRFFRLRLP